MVEVEPSGTLQKHLTQPSEKVAAPIKKTFKRNSPHHQKTNGASHVGGGVGAEAKTRGRGEELVLVPAWLAISLLTAYVVAGALLFR